MTSIHSNILFLSKERSKYGSLGQQFLFSQLVLEEALVRMKEEEAFTLFQNCHIKMERRGYTAAVEVPISWECPSCHNPNISKRRVCRHCGWQGQKDEVVQ